MNDPKEYIERGALIDAIEGTDWYHIGVKGNLVHGAISDGNALYKADDVFEVLNKFPTADVAPVVHGEWELFLCDEDAFEHHRCSVCKNLATFLYDNEMMWDENTDGEMVECGVFTDGITETLTPYCPCCGAKMDGRGRNESS